MFACVCVRFVMKMNTRFFRPWETDYHHHQLSISPPDSPASTSTSTSTSTSASSTTSVDNGALQLTKRRKCERCTCPNCKAIFTCVYCARQFSRSDHLQQHLTSVHDIVVVD
uniref:C2H2-type domain-containing protein n=1 Tax=Caenorhabditis japonica TaxID=281687 RepID=A0A8R1I726_CAEJA